MAKLPKLARTVGVGGTYYVQGDTPPLHHAKKITNARNWEGGEVPNFDTYMVDDEDTAEGIRNSSAANAQRSGLPGFAADQTGTGSEGAGTGEPAAGTGEPAAETSGDGTGTSTTAPAKTAARKATRPSA